MNDRDRQFLHRADKVCLGYEIRIQTLLNKLDSASVLDGLILIKKIDTLIGKQEEHIQRTEMLRAEAKRAADMRKLCTDANRLAGVAGANFWTETGKTFTEEDDFHV